MAQNVFNPETNYTIPLVGHRFDGYKLIDNARKSEYIQLKKDVYTILPNGIFLIESLNRLNISMDKFKTSEMGKALKMVYRGELVIDESVALAKNEIAQYFSGNKAVDIEDDTDTGLFGDEIGICPLCGSIVKKGKFYYGCTNYKNGCKFSIGSYICERAISKSNAKLLLETGRSSKIKGFKSKKGTTFDAFLKLEDGKCVFDFSQN